MNENLCEKCGAPIAEGETLCENCNIITDLNEPTVLGTTPEPQYLDYMVEEEPKKSKKGLVPKIIAIILGIIGGAYMLWYAIDLTVGNMQTIAQYTQMGMPVPKESLIAITISLVMLFSIAILAIVGAVLPRKFYATSAMLLGFAAAQNVVNGIPQLYMSMAQPELAFAEKLPVILTTVAGMFVLAAAILTLFTKKVESTCCCEESVIENEADFYPIEETTTQDVITEEFITEEEVIEEEKDNQ